MREGKPVLERAIPILEAVALLNGKPFEVGKLVVAADGTVHPRESDLPLDFTFAYRGCRCAARVPLDPGEPMTLSARVGVVPYSAESPLARRAVRRMLESAPPRGRFRVMAEGRILLEMAARIPRPRTPVHVMATLAALLVDARPYLELLDVITRPDVRPS